MKLSNPRNLRASSTNILNCIYTCDVDVTTGALWWKRITTKQVRRHFAGFWYFSDTGKFTPGYEMEELEKVCLARTSGITNDT